MCFETALYIFLRRSRIDQGKDSLEYIDAVIKQEDQVHEYEMVCFLFDCFKQATKKVLQLKIGEGGMPRPSKNSPSYQKFVDLIPFITDYEINPFSFFTFTVQSRRSKKIPFTIGNVCTERSINHYVDYQKSNTYRVSTYINFKEYEESLYNQLSIDLIGLSTYLLRKPRIFLCDSEKFLFSSFSKILLKMSTSGLGELTSQEVQFYEDLQFDPSFLSRMKSKWNQFLDHQVSKISQMHNPYLDTNFAKKLVDIVDLLTKLKLS